MVKVQPKANAQESPYASMSNNPIYYTDPLGLAAEGGGDDGGDGEPPSKNDDSASEKGDTFTGDDGKEYALTSSGGGKTVTRKDRAHAKIDKFEKEENISDFENISKSQLISDMRDLVNNPKNTEQCPNTCGISAVQYNLLNDAPSKFVDFVTDTYNSGDKPKVLNENRDGLVSVDYNDFNELEAEGNSASWIFQAVLPLKLS